MRAIYQACSLVPRPSHRPVFQRLQYGHTQTDINMSTDKHILSYTHIHVYMHTTSTHTHVHSHTFAITIAVISYKHVCSSLLLGTNSTYAPTTTWTRFIWEHHVDEVHLGRRAPCGSGSSGKESRDSGPVLHVPCYRAVGKISHTHLHIIVIHMTAVSTTPTSLHNVVQTPPHYNTMSWHVISPTHYIAMS